MLCKRFTLIALAIVLTVGCKDQPLGLQPEEPKKPLRFADGFKSTLAAGIPVGRLYFEGDCFLTEDALVDLVSSDSTIAVGAGGITVYPNPGPAWAWVEGVRPGKAMLHLFRFPEEGVLDSARVVVR